MAGMVGEEDDPAWKKILFNELVLVFIAAAVVLYIAFKLATRRGEAEEENPKKKKASAVERAG
jgi:threonine/homoserine/homoserine lactone efflux protein